MPYNFVDYWASTTTNLGPEKAVMSLLFTWHLPSNCVRKARKTSLVDGYARTSATSIWGPGRAVQTVCVMRL